MFSVKKFGAYVSQLRKNMDLTQSELADRLNLTRQAISKYEVGDSFPDISILILLAEIFGITLDELISSGEPSRVEAQVLESVISKTTGPAELHISDIINLAPLLKPSSLDQIARRLSKQGIDISNIVALAQYLSDESVVHLLESAAFDTIDDGLLERLIPFLNEKSKNVIFERILDGELDWRMLKAMLPYLEYMTSQIEAAIVDGALPREVLSMMYEYRYEEQGVGQHGEG